ncbi:kanadaptin isoform X2 [Corythoichthys intestinalis]|uniref:kanadaptin isoform X2 n=1 Tax=Corythoichthys intestinalis TaxID=161448 RepID=UPI0025A55F24|nr:kanadaptin isoform X2 [Corythoichthys intestinalis]XP_061798953.1 kanadaptin-like [Nerophis lumbriciformis]
MAASEQLDLGVLNTDKKETNSAMEMDKCAAAENNTEPEKKESPEADQDIAELFKKPTAFPVPSLASKRSLDAAAASKPGAETRLEKENNKAQVADTNSDASVSANGGQTLETGPEMNQNGDEHSDNATINVKTDSKHKVVPSKVPPVGKFPPLPYTEPHWGGPAPADVYSLEVLKNGTIVDKVPLAHKGFFVVGRLPVCDVPLEHPSISRYHAIIQYRQHPGNGDSVGEGRGFYIQDLGSTHGTVVNKNKIPPKTYIRLRVGHVLKFGGSTRLFIIQGPECDEEEESELTVTELKERGRKMRAELEKRMMGEGSDDEEEGAEKDEDKSGNSKLSSEDSGCSWGMAEEHLPEEDENEENPFSTEFHEDQEAAYLKDPKKALQGFYEREGEELEFEYEDKNHGSWLCRIKLPVDDALGRQLIAEVTHTGKKKEAAVQCCLEACRMLEARGVLRQEAVSRKRKKKNWEDEDYYDSDDDTFLDRTGTVEKKRKERMKRAGKIEERPDTHESLLAKLSQVEKEVAETQKKLGTHGKDTCGSSTDDPLDAFMTAVRSDATMDAVERRKLHVHIADLRKDAQRLRKLVELTRPSQLPSLLPSVNSKAEKPKKALPLFGAMKGGSKFKLKTGTIGKLPPKQPNLPSELFNMKELPPGGEEEEEEEEEENRTVQEETAENMEANEDKVCELNVDLVEASNLISQETSGQKGEKRVSEPKEKSPERSKTKTCTETGKLFLHQNSKPNHDPSSSESKNEVDTDLGARKKKKVMGPSRPPMQLSSQYPQDDPDYCVWVPPAGQTGDGRTHLNDKYGY